MDIRDFGLIRALVISKDWNVRALIAAQLRHDIGCQVDSADDLRAGLERLVYRADVVVIDWRDLELTAELWAKFSVARRNAPALVLASHLEVERLRQLCIDSSSILFRPFTIGEVAARTRELLMETRTYGRAYRRN